MSDSPDLAGFVDAQRRLRDKLGRSVTFFTPLAPVYPSSVASGQFDPETKLPYDPVVQPAGFRVPASGTVGSGFVGSGLASATAQCSVVFKPLTNTRLAPDEANALGTRDKSNMDLIADPSDVAVFQHATMFELDGARWQIQLVKKDGIGGFQRYVIYGEAIRG